jgi:hypothetical protein
MLTDEDPWFVNDMGYVPCILVLPDVWVINLVRVCSAKLSDEEAAACRSWDVCVVMRATNWCLVKSQSPDARHIICKTVQDSVHAVQPCTETRFSRVQARVDTQVCPVAPPTSATHPAA